MQFEEIRFRLRPRTLFEVMDLGLFMMRECAVGYAVLSALAIAPFLALNWGLIRLLDWHVNASIVLLILEAPMIGLPFTLFTADLVFQPRPKVLDAWVRAWSAFLGSTLQICVVRPVLFVFPLGFLLYQIRYRFSAEVSILERLAGVKKRQRLAFLQGYDRHGMGLMFIMLVVWLISVFGTLYAYNWIRLALLGEGSMFAQAIGHPGMITIHIMVSLQIGYWYVVTFLNYLDVRTAREGWDLSLELRLAAER